MELAVITTVCIGLSILLTPCVSQQIQLQPFHEQAHELQHPLPTLPRKLRLAAEVTVKGYGDKDSTSYSKPKEDFSGKPYHKAPGLLHGRGATWREWVEGTDTSHFFTMDYSSVRRRRPIHNKSLPVGP
ncbi:hypothetical protein L1049_006683 [Liquidambar formosana]|uniref:Uncharacterized protein n=1 Tax=Liquidambar formosana TaxID=63359 RepID=A0AAP0N563_LIQFO